MNKFEDEKIIPKLGDEIPTNWQKQAEAEIASGYRILTLDKFNKKENVEIHIFHPNQGIDSQSAEAYARAYSKHIKDPDIMPKKQLQKMLKEKGIWGDDEDQIVDATREKMREIEFQVASIRKSKRVNKAQMNRLRTAWLAKKQELQTLLVEFNMILSNTVEGLAENAERIVRLSHCVKYPDGERVWNSTEAIKAESNSGVLSLVAQEATLFWMGLTNEIINELPAELIFGGEEENQAPSEEERITT